MPGIGRREEKKRQTMYDIVSVATALFGEQGYERTKIEDIAASAGVSPGTVYNYFGTKGAVLTAVAGNNLEAVIAEAGTALDLSASDPVDALMPVIDVYIYETARFGKDLLKEVLRAGFDPHASDMLSDLITIDEAAVQQISMALGRMRETDLVSPSVDAASAAMLIYSILTTAMIWFVSVPDMQPESVSETARLQLTLVFRGIAGG